MFDLSWFGAATIGWILFSIILILYVCGDVHAPGPLGMATGLVYLLVESTGSQHTTTRDTMRGDGGAKHQVARVDHRDAHTHTSFLTPPASHHHRMSLSACACVVSLGRISLSHSLNSHLLGRLVGNRISNLCFLAWQYVFKKPNPILQIIYLTLVNGGYVLFYMYGQRHYIPNNSPHLPFIYLTLIFNFLSFLACAYSDPGIITKENMKDYKDMFQYDHQMYLPKTLCPTCVTEKPARSKHCSMDDHCVAKFDHHCVWVNRCIGLNNYRYFLWFLFQNVWFCSYATYMITKILQTIILTKDLWNVQYKDPSSGRLMKTDWYFIFQYITYYHSVLWGLLMIVVIMGCVLIGFSIYHMYLVFSNTTTNERSKRGWIEQGINVHSHHELYVLTPYYNKIQNELKEMNASIIVRAYNDIGKIPPPPKSQDPEDMKRYQALTFAATQACTKVAGGEGTGDETQTPPPAAAAASTPTSTKDNVTPAASTPLTPSTDLFPSGPYSPELLRMMSSYQTLKTEVLTVYGKLQRLQQQEFIDDTSEQRLKDGQGTSSEELVKAMKKGFTIAPREVSEGCVPPGMTNIMKTTSTSASPSSSPSPIDAAADAKKNTPNRQPRPNPYSLGMMGNLMQLLFPPKPGTRVPLSKEYVEYQKKNNKNNNNNNGNSNQTTQSDKKKAQQGKKER